MEDFPGVAGGLPVARFDEIGSTNAEALTRAASGAGEQWIVARKQLSGRGRRGRVWVSEPGNLYASLLLHDPAPPAVLPQICFVAGLALHDAVIDHAEGLASERLRLKWPNDLLLDEKKIAGILVEGAALNNEQAVVIGWGVNCRHHPVDTAYPTAAFATAGIRIEAELLFVSLASRIMDRLALWQRGAGFAAIRNAWLSRATGVGNEIEVRMPERSLRGRFEALDDAGALVLACADGQREIVHAGDVFPVSGMQ